MTITLPEDPPRWARFRMLTCPSFNGGTTGGGPWQTEALENPADNSFGYILLNYSRALLPQLGTATLAYRYGIFDGSIRGASAASGQSFKEGNSWDPDSDSMSLPDLRGKEILIQATEPDEDGNDGPWTAVFWGTCEYQLDHPWPGATVPGGEIHYHLVDAFHRTKYWRLDRHGFISAGVSVSPSPGHPGFNFSPDTPAQIAGNRDPAAGYWDAGSDSSGQYVTFLTHPGAGTKFTDKQCLEEAQATGRPGGQPLWAIVGAIELLDEKSIWEVSEDETVFSFFSRVFSRGRGLGAAFPDFEQSGTGKITPKMRVYAQIKETVTYTNTSTVDGGAVTLPGATSNGTVVDVDIVGDQRAVDLQLGDAQQYAVDYLEIVGENIEVMVTLEHPSTLEKGWSQSDQDDFLALDPAERLGEKWDVVYNMHRLKRGYKLNTSNGNGGAVTSADYRCNDGGTITTTKDRLGDSSLGTLVLLDDIPLYYGHTLTGDAFVRNDGQTAQDYDGTPQRKKPLFLIKTDADGEGLYRSVNSLLVGSQHNIYKDGILWSIDTDKKDGERYIGDVDEGGTYDYEDVVMTVAFRSSHRVRKAYGDPEGRRRKTIKVNGAHLWLCAPGVIWDLDYGDEDAALEEAPALRTSGSSPIVIRDDRSLINRAAALAVAWYGPQKFINKANVVHRGAEWVLRCCEGLSENGAGFIGAVYPKCGELVEVLKANGQRYVLNSPVSSIIYDNTQGTTRWTCDWQDLDMR